MKKVYLFIVIVCQLTSCTEQDSLDKVAFHDISGWYKVVSMISNVPIDLNDDGTPSIYFMDEIPEYFNGNAYDLLIRELDETEPFELVLGIHIPMPHSHIDKRFALATYNTNVYFLRIDPFDKETLVHATMEMDTSLTLDELIVQDERVIAKFGHRLFDFQTDTWKEVRLQVQYAKLD